MTPIDDILALCRANGFGLTIEFTPQGAVEVGYMRGMGGGYLAEGMDAYEACDLAIEPLKDKIARSQEFTR
jgi:hypothetical protein